MVVVGIDYGTTFSTFVIATTNSLVLYTHNGSEFVPSLVGYKEGKVAVGHSVLLQNGDDDPEFTIYRDMKRWVGVNLKNSSEKLKRLKPNYKVEPAENMMDLKIGSSNNSAAPPLYIRELISRFIIVCLEDFAKKRKFKVDGLVISVPAKYTSQQRFFMSSLGTIIGHPIVHIMNEPSAALFASVYNRSLSSPFEYYIVYDFGGGTFDVSVVGRYGSKYSVFFSGGDEELGGRDVDRSIEEFLKRKYNITGKIEFSISLMKEEVCSTKGTATRDHNNTIVSLTYEDLTLIAAPYLKRANDIMNKTYRESELDSRVWVVPIGGSASLPGAVESNRESMRRNLHDLILAERPRSAVAEGCALFSSTLADGENLFVDCVTSHISALKTLLQPMVIIPAGAPLPISVKWETTCTRSNQNWTVGIYEGNSNRIYNNVQLVKFKVSAEIYKVNTFPFTWYVEAKMNSMGVINIESYCNKNSTRITLSTPVPKYEKLKPLELAVVDSLESDLNVWSPLAITDLKVSSLHKKYYDKLEFAGYLSYFKNLKINRKALVEFDLLNTYGSYSSLYEFKYGLDSFLQRRRPLPKFLRDEGYLEFDK